MYNVKVGEYYYYKQQTSKYHTFEGVIVVDILKNNDEFVGALVHKVENTAGWVTERINLWSEHIVKKISRETHPEYFL